MTGAESDGDSPRLDGLPVERAASCVTVDGKNSDEVRETLAIVARDGVVRRAAVDDSGLVTLDDYDGHPSVRSLVDDDYEIITF